MKLNDVEEISKFQLLERLDVANCILTSGSLSSFGAATALQKALEKLDVSDNDLGVQRARGNREPRGTKESASPLSSKYAEETRCQ